MARVAKSPREGRGAKEAPKTRLPLDAAKGPQAEGHATAGDVQAGGGSERPV